MHFHNFLHFTIHFIIIITLLAAVSTYCLLVKYQAKPKHLLHCHYSASRLKETRYYEMGINYKLKEIIIKDRTCYYFDDIIKLKDFNHDNILTNKNHTKKF